LKKITFRTLAAVALASLAAVAGAQDVKDTLEVNRQAIESQRRILVAGALPLTDGEADAFWPLYDAYEKERRPIDERANKLVAGFLAGALMLRGAPGGRDASPVCRLFRRVRSWSVPSGPPTAAAARPAASPDQG
jgi:hypothetical protein